MTKVLVDNITGPIGATGPQGIQGIQGIQGPQGPPGDVTGMLPLSGGTLTGALILSEDPLVSLEAATKQYVDNNAVQPDPDAFLVDDYGAVGNAFFASDISTNGTQTFQSPTIAANATVGMWVMIEGGRTIPDTAAIGQITAISAPSVTISNVVGITSTNSSLPAWCGTDDTAAFNAAAVAANGVGYVKLSNKRYVVATNHQSNDGNILFNSAIMVPPPADNNIGGKIIPTIKGVFRQDNTAYWNEEFPNSHGSCIIAMISAPNDIDPTWGPQSVISTGIPQAGMAGPFSPPTFVNSKMVVENVKIIVPYLSNLTGFDFSYVSGLYMDGCSVYAFATSETGNGNHMLTEYSNSIWDFKQSVGIRTPIFGNNADVYLKSVVVVGVKIGLSIAAEHARVDHYVVLYTQLALRVDGGEHGLSIGHVTAEGYVGGFQYANGGSLPTPVFVESWSTESSANAYDIYDPGNGFRGYFNWYDTVDARDIIVNGGANLNIRNCVIALGLWSGAPALAASGVDMINTSYRPATVIIDGGVVTQVNVNGVTLGGITSGPVKVPAGGALNITYSSAPTLQWFLE